MTYLELARFLREQAAAVAEGHRRMLDQDRAADADELRRLYDDCVRNYETQDPVKKLVDSTDWALLWQQKADLVELISGQVTVQEVSDSLSGILGFLDAAQDAAAEILGENEVFGKDGE